MNAMLRRLLDASGRELVGPRDPDAIRARLILAEALARPISLREDPRDLRFLPTAIVEESP